MVLIQVIIIEDYCYEQVLKLVDYIKCYIFLGSFILLVSVMFGVVG